MTSNISRPYLGRRLKLQTVSPNPLSLRIRFKGNPLYQYALTNLNDDDDEGISFSIVANRRLDGDFIGYAKGFYRPEHRGIWIQIFLIQASHLRQGFGTEFYHDLCDFLSGHCPFERIFLSCHQENAAGCGFWEKLGFTLMTQTSKPDPATGLAHPINIYENSFTR